MRGQLDSRWRAVQVLDFGASGVCGSNRDSLGSWRSQKKRPAWQQGLGGTLV